MKALEECTAGIAGLGLMGGAFARAFDRLKRGGAGPKRIAAYDTDGAVLEQACSEGLIDQACARPEDMLEQSDLVLLCLAPSAMIDFAESRMASFKSGSLVTDIAGIKERAAALAGRFRDDVDFIPGHPMAGVEGAGFAASANVRFAEKNYILTTLPRNKPENIAWLKELITRLGFAHVTETSPEDHDSKIAFTSQLCHVIAASLVDCEEDRTITRYGGGSFEDLTRIALLNAPMWTELFLENREKLLERITGFEKSLAAIRDLIAGRRAEELEARLSAVRERRAAMR